MQIRRVTFAALLSAAAAAGQRGSLTLICTVEGGVACRLVQGEWNDAATTELPGLLLDDLGYKLIEHAAGRQAVLRCAIASGTCEIDLGDGFMSLAVVEDGGNA